MLAVIIAGFALSIALPYFGLLNKYVIFVLISVGINVILTISLNLVNGFMGEFSVGHAGFMAVGAYGAAVTSVNVIPRWMGAAAFPTAILAGGLAAALVSLFVAIPSFKTRGDYLAIVTLAFAMIVKSALENMDVLGGPRGFMGMQQFTTLPWVFFWMVLSLWAIRNFVYSAYGRGVLSIREDETASELSGVDTRKVKVLTFALSSFFAGVAGGLYAHLLQFINPSMFDVIKSTEMLIMVYLGGVGSIAGSILGASIYTILMEVLRPMGVWRMVLMPAVLILLMIFRPRGIMGLRELRWFVYKAIPHSGAAAKGQNIGNT
ncbi:MAG: branched-chain amino acid ABC transporter permease [Nitrospirae bacterium]|nr:branched-chain amino acid ABC transporter permease [Nitrospirota bacterium]